MTLTFTPDSFRYAFGSHDRVTIEHIHYRPLSSNEVGHLMSSVDGTGVSQSFTHAQLSRLGSMGRLSHEPNYFRPEQAAQRLVPVTQVISTLSPNAQARLSKRSAYVEAFLELQAEGKIKRTDASILANEDNLRSRAMVMIKGSRHLSQCAPSPSLDISHVPSPKTLRSWLKDMEAFGMQGLADGMHKRGNRNRVMGLEELRLLKSEVDLYLSEEQPTMAMIQQNVVLRFAKRNEERRAQGLAPFPVPSKETVRREINRLDRFTVTVARHGLAAARKKFRPVGQGQGLSRPLERVEIDEWQIDLLTHMHSAGLIDYLTDEERRDLGLDGTKARWMVSVAICATTRCILGMTLSPSAKSSAALKTVEMVLCDKGQWADAVGALGSWDMHGTPELIVTDCGSAFKSDAFRLPCGDLGITVKRAPAGFPELRGRIERLFGTMARDLLPRLSGRTFADIITKGDSNPDKRVALTIDDLAFVLVRWIVDIYHNTPHEGLDGVTPLMCWRRLTKKVGVMPPPDLRRRRLAFGSHLVRRLDKEGVRVLNLRYHSERLAAWMNRRDSCEVHLRWYPQDIGKIEVKLGQEWFEVPAVEEGFDGVNAQTWVTTSRQLRATDPFQKDFDRHVIHTALDAITDRNKAAMATAGLLVPDWSADRIKREEDRNMVSFRVSGTAPKSVTKAGQAGQSIPDPEGDRATAQKSAQPSRIPQTAPTTWTLEEDAP